VVGIGWAWSLSCRVVAVGIVASICMHWPLPEVALGSQTWHPYDLCGQVVLVG